MHARLWARHLEPDYFAELGGVQGQIRERGKAEDLIRIFFLGNDSLTSVRALRKGVKKIFNTNLAGQFFCLHINRIILIRQPIGMAI